MSDDEAAGGEVYEIRLKGKLDAKWSNWFAGMAVAHDTAADGAELTVLCGRLPDQAALRGILTKAWDLNLIVLSLHLQSQEVRNDAGGDDD